MGRLEAIYKSGPIALQTLMVNAKAAELHLERFGRKFDRVEAEFIANEHASPETVEAYQVSRLREIVHHAYKHTEYYRELFDRFGIRPCEIRDHRDLGRLPVLTKDDIRANFDRMLARNVPSWKRRYGVTSGTTGAALRLAYDVHTCVVHQAADWRQKRWAGMSRQHAIATLQGRLVVPVSQSRPPFWRRNYVNNQFLFSSFHLKAEFLPSYVADMRRLGIQYLEGYPSTVWMLAEFLNESGDTLPLQAVFTSSETMHDWQRESIERAFACRVFDAYGMAERTVYASECEHHDGKHVNEDYGIVEILDNEGNAKQDGQIGSLVATSLHNTAMPLLRYRTNDATSLDRAPCVCGRPFRSMRQVTTKQESIVTLPDGRLITPSALTHPFKRMDRIAESQIMQESTSRITVRLVPRAGFGPDDERQLLLDLRERLGSEIEIAFELVSEIPRSASGKFRWVVSSVRPRFSSDV